MNFQVLVAVLVIALPGLAGAQQNPGTQAQGQGSVQGSASVERSNGGVQSQAAGSGSGSGSVSHGDKSVGASSGATTNAVLSGSLDSRKSKPGDPVTAKTTEPSTTEDHQTLPKGTKLLGHVTEAKSAGGEAQSALGFTFDRAVLKDGREVPIHTTLRALAAGEGAADVAGNSAGAMGGAAMSGGGGMGGGASGGGGALGGLGARAGGVVGGVGGQVTGAAAGSVGAVGGASGRALSASAGAIGGVNARGMLSPESHGVFGLRAVTLTQSSSGGGSLVTSSGRSLHLESGTRMLLGVESGAAQTTGSAAASGQGSVTSAPAADKSAAPKPAP